MPPKNKVPLDINNAVWRLGLKRKGADRVETEQKAQVKTKIDHSNDKSGQYSSSNPKESGKKEVSRTNSQIHK